MSWPPHALTLTTPDLVLRGMTEADALALTVGFPAPDLDRDPDRPDLGHDVLQTYARCVGNWSVDDWTLPFTVLRDGRPIGAQALEGKHFQQVRVVDSWSWLYPEARRQGFGTQMRAAVLELAFTVLGAVRAVSEAWEDNVASLGVSWRLGYVDNGIDLERREQGVGHMQRLRLDARDWICPVPVTITGAQDCLALFGL